MTMTIKSYTISMYWSAYGLVLIQKLQLLAGLKRPFCFCSVGWNGTCICYSLVGILGGYLYY